MNDQYFRRAGKGAEAAQGIHLDVTDTEQYESGHG
jgi:hypothetical protein